jgi:hypothetical protein
MYFVGEVVSGAVVDDDDDSPPTPLVVVVAAAIPLVVSPATQRGATATGREERAWTGTPK